MKPAMRFPGDFFNAWKLRPLALLLMAVAATMPFSIRLNTNLILLSGVAWVLEGGLKEKIRATYSQPFNVLMAVFFLLHVLSVFTSLNQEEANAILERRFS